MELDVMTTQHVTMNNGQQTPATDGIFDLISRVYKRVLWDAQRGDVEAERFLDVVAPDWRERQKRGKRKGLAQWQWRAEATDATIIAKYGPMEPASVSTLGPATLATCAPSLTPTSKPSAKLRV